jgi:hypothetical protein
MLVGEDRWCVARWATSVAHAVVWSLPSPSPSLSSAAPASIPVPPSSDGAPWTQVRGESGKAVSDLT